MPGYRGSACCAAHGEAGTSREGRLLGEASRIDGHSLDWSLERMEAL
jgi:hypothetical protein